MTVAEKPYALLALDVLESATGFCEEGHAPELVYVSGLPVAICVACGTYWLATRMPTIEDPDTRAEVGQFLTNAREIQPKWPLFVGTGGALLNEHEAGIVLADLIEVCLRSPEFRDAMMQAIVEAENESLNGETK